MLVPQLVLRVTTPVLTCILTNDASVELGKLGALA
jgi:hypothetical protein